MQSLYETLPLINLAFTDAPLRLTHCRLGDDNEA